jgi:multiple sugar transport system substrate-binding protein
MASRMTPRSRRGGADGRRPPGKSQIGTVALMIGLALTAVLAASSSGATANTKSAKVTNLTFWSWASGSQQAVDAWNKTHPSIHVTFDQIPSGGYSKILDAFKAGHEPDTFNLGYDVQNSFVTAGALANLNSYMTPAVKKAYLPQALALSSLGGTTWGLPYDVGAQVMYYRADLFKKYGLAVPKTWAQFQADAVKLKSEAPGVYMANYSVDDPLDLAALVWQAGGQWFSTSGDTWHVNFFDPATTKVANYWDGLNKQGLLDPVVSYGTADTADTTNNKILTLISASWNAAYVPTSWPKEAGDWAAAPMPTFGGKPASGMYGGSTVAVGKSSANQAAAFQFAEWMTNSAAVVNARVAAGVSTPYLASSVAMKAAQKAFKSSFYAGGQDVYKVISAAGASLKPTWIWGPTMLGTEQAMTDALKKGDVMAGLKAGQADAISEMKALGLKVN